ncbi:putative dITP/XTP pyrophosphatase [Campylobacter blaseri]|uniref:dITP/XTP pyrophosphatase n=1 Tax=Campylobacter blaseri TaxID=2042961 RepID=A0A2P8R489_9BACT|nr:non-canonical purine NTP pyrophosphatase [Campylobacter blaseri]PSM53283.1 non-canonical purine NTP pyrophosphatase [Campylobacter blaseri]PSM54749.1 non-canonical purine NTP pyrophosphatase [Campylobacter blaseri]QKF86769.1 putative dITP/XTP pyrophosphatase [Campylobacter blaseri]
MKIVIATGNKNKVKEIKDFYNKFEIYALDELIKPFEIVENGKSFKENALIKSKAVFEALSEKQKDEFIVLSDDSGICVDALSGNPGIHSARYSGKNATDKTNRAKIILELNKLGLSSANAHYTACIAISSKFGDYTTHGFMYGKVINEERGENGFGYDFMFIPNGFTQTIGELSQDIKLQISHRSKGLELAKFILNILEKNYRMK